jgi:hypothetical protein
MMLRHALEPSLSTFTVHAFAGGMLSVLAHSPTFAIRDFRGSATFDPEALAGELDMTVRAESLELLDKVKPADQQDIEGRMRREVLDTAHDPEIRYGAARVTATPAGEYTYRVRLEGPLLLRGVWRDLAVKARLRLFGDGLRLEGGFTLRPSDFGIRPVTAVAGMITLKDELRFAFDIAAQRLEGP